MKWIVGTLAVLVVGLGAVAWLGWQAVEDLETELAALSAAVDDLDAESDQEGAQVDVFLHQQIEDLSTTDVGIAQDLEDLATADDETAGRLADAENAIDSLVDEVAGIPALILAMQPTSPSPASSPEPAGPTVEWCAEYQLNLENAGNAAARAQGLSGMNFGQYQEWVIAPMVDVGCPSPND
ncbi:MAG: hypothetical protein ACRDWS_12960 [Acidimicrobiia bacterium]